MPASEPNGASDLPTSSLKPPRGEILPSFWEQHGTWIILGGLAVVGIMGAVIWRLARPKPAAPVFPGVQARRELEVLREQREDGALLSKTSQILRRYFTASFGLAPGEYTTAEFCGEAARCQEMGPELARAAGAFLRECDFRKFAPESPAPPFGAVAQALKLVDQGESRLSELQQAAAANSKDASKTSDGPGVRQAA